jgi:hypothetical protein
MTTAYTSLLGLALPVTGELQGTWGDTVNNSITSLLDTAVAGTTTLSTDANVTLSTTTGASNQARQAIILWTASGTVTRTITAPAQSKIYTIINRSSTQSIKIVGVGPTTGVTIKSGATVTVAWNGLDFVEISVSTLFPTVTISGNMDNGTTDYSLNNTPTIQDNVTTNASIYRSAPATDTGDTWATPLSTLYGYLASQGTFKASSVTTQAGFYANSLLVGAQFNYGFYSNIATKSTLTITGISGNGTTVTVDTSGSHGLAQGDIVTIIGVSNADMTSGTYNGQFTVLSIVDSNTFTYTSSAQSSVTPTSGSVVPLGRWNFYANGTGQNYFGGSTTVETSSVLPALRITQLGTGNALLVEDSANPDSTPFVIDATGRPVVGYTSTLTSRIGATSITPALQVVGTSFSISSFGQWGWNATPYHVFSRSASATIGTQSVVSSGDTFGILEFTGDDGTNFTSGARISAAVDGTPGTDAMPGRISLFTTRGGAFTVSTVVRTSNVVTLTATASISASVGDTVVVAGVTNATFNGTFTITDVYGTIITYAQTASDASSSGGTATVQVTTPTEHVRLNNSGNVGIGSTSITNTSLRVSNKITGSASSYGIYNDGVIQKDVTTSAYGMSTTVGLVANANPGAVVGYSAGQGTWGSGAAAPAQYGFLAQSLSNAGANYSFYGSSTSGQTSKTITFVARTSNVATVTTSTAHGYVVGGRVQVSTVSDSSFVVANTTVTSVPTSTTFTYASSGSNVATTAETGSVVYQDSWNFYAAGTAPIFSSGPIYMGVPFGSSNGLTASYFQMNSAGSSNSSIQLGSWSSNSTTYPQINFAHSGGSAVGDYRGLVDGDIVGQIAFCGGRASTYDFEQGAAIRAVAQGTTSTYIPTRMEFYTGGDAYTYRSRMRLDKIGQQTQFGPLVVSNTLRNDVTYDSKSFDASTQDSGVTGIAFRPDGKMMYILGTSGDDITYYSLSTAWDISTATFVSQSNSTTAQNGTPQGLYFKPDGTKVFIVGSTAPAGIWAYSCVSPWDVSTLTYDSKTLDLSAVTTSPTGVWFKPDGTKMYIASNTGATSTYTDTVLEYALSTAWDVSSGSLTTYFSTASQDTSPQGVQFTDDGMRMFVAGSVGDNVVIYDLLTAWDLSTASFTVETSNLQTMSGATLTITDLYVEPNGKKLYILSDTGSGAGTNMVYQFTGLEPATINLTGDTTISGNTTINQDLTVRGSLTVPVGTGANTTATGNSFGNVCSGRYTPTLTNTTNVSSSTPVQLYYMRVGNVVTITGRVDVTTTATGNTVLGLSFPIASAISTNAQVGGVLVCVSSTVSLNTYGRINGDTTNARALLQWNSTSTSATTYSINFTYEVV